MSIACPVDLDTRMLRFEISSIYGRVAVEPTAEFHFHRGPAYAAEFLGYDAEELASLPLECSASFAGVSNPLAIGPIRAGETVVDIGCGAGMDLLLAASRVGTEGRAIGVDMTETMIERARSSAVGLKQVEVRKGDATSLPVSDGSVDVVISNGVLNLVPEKELGFAEIVRILKPGGRLHLGDIGPPGYWARHAGEGDLSNWRRSGADEGCGFNAVHRDSGHPEVGEGHGTDDAG
jgi:arsenite methyltransferase